jgi:hypothetical protein
MTKLRGRFALALIAMTATLLSTTAVPAHAAWYGCTRTGGWPQNHCWVGYQAFPYGQTSGLRSSMQGYADGPNIGITASQQAGFDDILVKLRVWDLKEDGYRARVWVDIFRGCHCTNEAYQVEVGPWEHQYAGRVFDATNNAGVDRQWWYTAEGSATNYTVRIQLGRYQSSTGNYERGEEQVYTLVVN